MLYKQDTIPLLRLKKKLIVCILYLWVEVVPTCECRYRLSLEKDVEPPGLELQLVVSHLKWVLET